LDAMPGTRLAVECEGFRRRLEATVAELQDEPQRFEFVLAPEVDGNYRITVAEQSPTGQNKPLEGARVVIQHSGGEQKVIETGQDGRVSYGARLPFGSPVQFVATLRDYMQHEPLSLEHQPGQQTEVLLMVYRPDTTTVSFTVRDEDTGELVTDGYGRLAVGRERHFRDDKPGILEFPGVDRNEEITVTFVTGNARAHRTIHPARDQTNRYQINVSRRGQLTVEVHGDQSRLARVPGAAVYRVEGDQRIWLGKTDQQGRLTIELRYGTARFHVIPPSAPYSPTTSALVAFLDDGQVTSLIVQRGDPERECTDCVAELRRIIGYGCERDQVGPQIDQLLSWCNEDRFPGKSTERRLELWREAIQAFGHGIAACPDAQIGRYADQAVDLLDVQNLENHQRCVYYAFRAWVYLVQLEAGGQEDTGLIETAIENAETARSYYAYYQAAEPDYSICVNAYIRYIEGKARYYKHLLLQNRGTPDPSESARAAQYMKEYLFYTDKHGSCGWPESWRQDAEDIQIVFGETNR